MQTDIDLEPNTSMQILRTARLIVSIWHLRYWAAAGKYKTGNVAKIPCSSQVFRVDGSEPSDNGLGKQSTGKARTA